MGFCLNMRNHRRAKGYTQDELAKLCNVSAVSIHQWETGHHKPTKNNILQMARVLGTTYEELMKGDEADG